MKFSLHTGYSAFPNKLDALLWSLALEVDVGAPYGDKQACITAYARQVVSCLSDQGYLTNNSVCVLVCCDSSYCFEILTIQSVSGTEIKLAGAPLVDMKGLSLDADTHLSSGTAADMEAIMDRQTEGESSLPSLCFSMAPLQFQDEESLLSLGCKITD